MKGAEVSTWKQFPESKSISESFINMTQYLFK